jgi:hypothetical protein
MIWHSCRTTRRSGEPADEYHSEDLRGHAPRDVARLRADHHRNADLPPPLIDRVGEDPYRPTAASKAATLAKNSASSARTLSRTV